MNFHINSYENLLINLSDISDRNLIKDVSHVMIDDKKYNSSPYYHNLFSESIYRQIFNIIESFIWDDTILS